MIGTQQKEDIKLSRNNKNYLYMKKIFEKVENKSLKISAFEYFVFNRKIYYPGITKNKSEYLVNVNLSDILFSFEDMFFLETSVNFNPDLSMKKNEIDPLILLEKKEINIKEAYIRMMRMKKKRFMEIFNIKVLNSFDSSGGMTLELNLEKPLEDLQEELKLAKRFFDKEMEKIKKENNLNFEVNTILDNEFLQKMKNKQDRAIPYDEKLIDLLFIIDCLLLEYKPKEIKLLLQDYYIINYSDKNINLGYLLTDYYKQLVKEAKKIVNNIKKGV